MPISRTAAVLSETFLDKRQKFCYTIENCHAAEDSIDHDNDYETITEGDEDNHDDGNYDDVNQMTMTTTNKRQLRRMVIIFFFLLLNVHFYNTDPKILKFILHV